MAVPTVATLSARLGPDLHPAPGTLLTDVPVTAVHISELPDPTAFLSGGELLLTTGLAVPPTAAGCRTYVARVADAGVSALALGLGPIHDQVPDRLADACAAASLPLLVVPPATPFLTVTRAFWTALAKDTEQRLTEAIDISRQLVEAAALDDAPAQIARQLARWLDGWAAVLDVDGAVVQLQPPGRQEVGAAVQRAVERMRLAGALSAATFPIDDDVAVMYPLAIRQRVSGYLVVGAPGQLEQAQRRVLTAAAGLLSLDHLRARGAAARVVAFREALARLVGADRLEAAAELAEQVRIPFRFDRVRVLEIRPSTAGSVAEIVEAVRDDEHWPVTDGDHVWVLQVGEPEGPGPGDRVLAVDPRARVAYSGSVGLERVPGVRAGLAEAVELLGSGQVEHCGDRWDWTDFNARVDELAGAGEELIAAVVAHLRHRGHWERAARDLGVHRNTLRYRVERASTVTGLDLDEPDVAARLWLALRQRGVR